MGEDGCDYEIRLHHPDGALLRIATLRASSIAAAKAQTVPLLKEDMSHATIWRDGEIVDRLYFIRTTGPLFRNA